MENYFYNLQGGLNTELTPVKMGANTQKMYWTDSFNVEPYKKQGIIRQKGNQKILDLEETFTEPETAPGAVVGFIPYPEGTKNLILALVNGQIVYYNAALRSLKEVYNFNREVQKFGFRYFLDGLVILPVKYTGQAFNGIYFNENSNTPVQSLNFINQDRSDVLPDGVCSYAGRLWLSAGNTLYYSALGTFNDWSTSHDAGYISNFHSSTGKITAMEGYRDALAIYKKNEVFLLTGNDPETFAITKFADKGAPGNGAVVSCNNKQYFFNEHGLFSLSYVGELSQIVMGSNCAKNVLKLLEKLDISRLSEIKTVSYERKNQIWIFPSIIDETGQKEVWIYDYELDSWFLRVIPFEIIDSVVVSGEIYTTGKTRIFVENTGNTFCGKTINFRFSTPFFNFSKPTVSKIIGDFEIICDGVSENNFDFSVSSDYMSENVTVPETVSVNLPNVLVWEGIEDNFAATMWSDGEIGAIWNDVLQENLKLDIFEANKAIQLHFEGNKPGQDLAIIGFEFKDILFEQ